MTQLTRQQILAEATAAQKPATRAQVSAVVDASAGSGKTYVLTQRILALLMDGGVDFPEQILAVTYTRAAAAEMAERVRHALADWATMPQDKLTKQLHDLLDREITEEDIRKARNLFAVVLDAPQGLNISTIHAFCQSLLARFPLEANLTPGFTLIEPADQQQLLQSALGQVLLEASEGKADIPAWVFAYMTGRRADSTLTSTYTDFVANRRRFIKLRQAHGGFAGLLQNLAQALNMDDLPQNNSDLARFAPQTMPVPEAVLQAVRDLIGMAPQGKKTIQDWAQVAALWAENPAAASDAVWNGLQKGLVTNGRVNSNFITKDLDAAYPHATELAEQVIAFIAAAENRANSAETWLLTMAWLSLGYCIVDRYEQQKKSRGLLDFDDLIAATQNLLAGESGQGAWVRYKLDSQLKHVLVDEAQDTDHDQWQILSALREDFYSGDGQHDDIRTMFAVGDPKQAIYRFRGAVPALFARLYPELKAQGEAVDRVVEKVEMTTSFRSSPPILQAVDQVFATPARRRLIDGQTEPLAHRSKHVGAAGTVELWPLEREDNEDDDKTPWPMPARKAPAPTARRTLYRNVALWIKQKLAEKPLLTTTEPPRPLRAGDILLLLRSKTHVAELIAALNREGIASTQAEEVYLANAPVVDDLLALLRFLANADDDLALLQVLRSPLFGLTDADMLQLLSSREERGGSLWRAVFSSKMFTEAKDVLTVLLREADFMTPHALLLLALEKTQGRSKLCRRLSGHEEGAATEAIAETLDAFLDVIHGYNQHHMPGLAGFLHWFETSDIRVKREAASDPDAVRVMTAHGSKGLQAPIVILPDATSGYFDQQNKEQVQWLQNEYSDDVLVVHGIGADRDVPLVRYAKEAEKTRVREDEMRLLYVAMTRAQEHLLIGGIHKGKNPYTPPAESKQWYDDIYDAATTHGWQPTENGGYILHVGADMPLDNALHESVTPVATTVATPAWALADIVAESTPQALTASAQTLEERSRTQALLDGENNHIYRRGLLVHRLLEWLPRFAPDERVARGEKFLSRHGRDLPETARRKLLDEALAVMAACPDVFAEGLRSEVSLAAHLDAGLLDGARVDALRVTDDAVLVVDFKTNAKIPEKMPEAYRKQLGMYADAARRIWPQKRVATAVLWTAANPPRLDWIEPLARD